MRHAGTVVAGHEKLEFELHGCATRKQGGADPAVSDIEISFGRVQEKDLEKRNFERLTPALNKFGLGKPKGTGRGSAQVM